jgi:hypothetical protein
MAQPRPKVERVECPVRVSCDGAMIRKDLSSCGACARTLHRRKFIGSTDRRHVQGR